MRRLTVLPRPGFWRVLALSLLLLCAQHLLLAHAVEHAGALEHRQDAPVEISCHDCLAFNHLPDAPTGKSLVPAVSDGIACLAAGLQRLPLHAAAGLAYAIRAPPSLPKPA